MEADAAKTSAAQTSAAKTSAAQTGAARTGAAKTGAAQTGSAEADAAYRKVLLARSTERPGVTDFIEALFDGFLELHGDRRFRDDPAVVGGIGFFHGTPVTVIGHRKGRSTEEKIQCSFGMASPEGYRKAVRLMEQAEKFRRPVITLIDTPGAYPGVEAESNGQSNAIAESILCMLRLRVPTVAVVTGEGSSGGALALAAADRVFMLENAVYSILSPEGFASILWKDAKRAPEASRLTRMTAEDLLSDGLIDGVLPEDARLFPELDRALAETLGALEKQKEEELLKNRYRRYRRLDGLYRSHGA